MVRKARPKSLNVTLPLAHARCHLGMMSDHCRPLLPDAAGLELSPPTMLTVPSLLRPSNRERLFSSCSAVIPQLFSQERLFDSSWPAVGQQLFN